jgi:DNA-binding FrmR family transcriptional regulator
MGSTHKHRKKVIDRLSRIEGHIELILEDHIESCMVDAINDGSTEEYVKDLKEAISKLI